MNRLIIVVVNIRGAVLSKNSKYVRIEGKFFFIVVEFLFSADLCLTWKYFASCHKLTRCRGPGRVVVFIGRVVN